MLVLTHGQLPITHGECLLLPIGSVPTAHWWCCSSPSVSMYLHTFAVSLFDCFRTGLRVHLDHVIQRASDQHHLAPVVHFRFVQTPVLLQCPYKRILTGNQLPPATNMSTSVPYIPKSTVRPVQCMVCRTFGHFFKVRYGVRPWWSHTFGHTLHRLAERFLSVPPTSALSECLFRDAGRLYDERRSRLLPESAEKMLFLMNNLQNI